MALSFMQAVESSSFAADNFPSRSNWRAAGEEIREEREGGERRKEETEQLVQGDGRMGIDRNRQ